MLRRLTFLGMAALVATILDYTATPIVTRNTTLVLSRHIQIDYNSFVYCIVRPVVALSHYAADPPRNQGYSCQTLPNVASRLLTPFGLTFLCRTPLTTLAKGFGKPEWRGMLASAE
jgi:hypothetical protein